LEGCDSTTELLPPTRRVAFARAALRRGKPAVLSRLPDHLTAASPSQNPSPKPALAITHWPAEPAGLPSRSRPRDHPLACRAEAARAIAPARRRLVAREGLEPSKPLGRQIYSLLRLTASLPRQLCCIEC